MYEYGQSGMDTALSQFPPLQTPSTSPGDERGELNSGTMHLGRRRSSVRLIPTTDIDKEVDDRQSQNLAHSKNELRRRSSVHMRQRLLMRQQMMMRMGQPPRRISLQGDPRLTQAVPPPLQQLQPQQQVPYVRQPVRRTSNSSADVAPTPPPLPPPQPQPQQPMTAAEGWNPRKPASNLNGSPPASAVQQRGSQYQPAQKGPPPPQQQQQELRVRHESEAVPSQSARRSTMLAEKAKQQSRYRRRSETPANASPPEEEKEKKATPPPSFTKRLSMFFAPSSAHRRESKDDKNESSKHSRRNHGSHDHRRNDHTKDTKSKSNDRKHRHKSTRSSSHRVTRLSAVEEAAPKNRSEKALEELDSVLANREEAMKRPSLVQRTQSFFGSFAHESDHSGDDDDVKVDECDRQASNSSPSSSDSGTDSSSPDDNPRPINDSANPEEADTNGLHNDSAAAAAARETTERGAGEREDNGAGAESDNITPSPGVESADVGNGSEQGERNRTDTENIDNDGGGSGGSSDDSSSSSDEAKEHNEASVSERPLLPSNSPSNECVASSYFKIDTSQSTNGESPSDTPNDLPVNVRQQQLAAANQARAASVPFMSPVQHCNGGVPPIQNVNDHRRQTVPQQANSTLSMNPQPPLPVPQPQMQKGVSMLYPRDDMRHQNAAPRQATVPEGRNPVLLPPPGHNSFSMPNGFMTPPNGAMMMNQQRSFMVPPGVPPPMMTMRYPMPRQGYPMPMAQQQQQRQLFLQQQQFAKQNQQFAAHPQRQ
ncbi:hypothetical protein ABB37_05855 [Leptomonas pyrrhocoris]|uniref:Uncharacterized protein n=1 Tax=Leptomonas pyrrhocoris TaxID=157538 RepID=A0A0N0DUL2_LEPPY|nr:hypothetical protein ABB37_05855 [Leptomonas pyrrhocoris]KPA78731.1 hypothetical protein ABB37_05855 [Leptomonas pyrrhocoris]|eukprot:XP_015657170.1 hypothetical protein ABB37_05855 [Leptomonas pyrrhocoris]